MGLRDEIATALVAAAARDFPDWPDDAPLEQDLRWAADAALPAVEAWIAARLPTGTAMADLIDAADTLALAEAPGGYRARVGRHLHGALLPRLTDGAK
jgi:hypothetical protein